MTRLFGRELSAPAPQAVLTTSKLACKPKKGGSRATLTPLYEFPFGLKEIDFGKQTTNYKLHGSCFIIRNKRTILHEKLLNVAYLLHLSQH